MASLAHAHRGHELARRIGFAALESRAAALVERLRREAQVG